LVPQQHDVEKTPLSLIVDPTSLLSVWTTPLIFTYLPRASDSCESLISNAFIE
jgi:hypothetical protein